MWEGIEFSLRPANVPDAVAGKTIPLPQGKFGTLSLLATGVEGGQESQVFTITYADGTSSTVTQSLSDWYEPGGYKGESQAIVAPYRLAGNGSKDKRSFYLYGYSFNLDSNKMVRSVTLPDNEHVLIFAITLVKPTAPLQGRNRCNRKEQRSYQILLAR